MPDSLNRGGDGSSNSVTAKTFFPVKVKKVIFDGTNPHNEKWGGYDSVGTIFYTRIKTKGLNYDTSQNLEELEDDRVVYEGTAIPLFNFQKQYPLVNETVLVISSVSAAHIIDDGAQQSYYLPPMNLWNSPHVNPIPSIKNYEPQGEGEAKTIQDYIDNGLVKRTLKEGEGSDGEIIIPLGKYFREQLNIKSLLHYEGDTILEGRFGNSIRFGATARHESIPKKDKHNKDAKGFTAVNEWSKGAKGDIGDPITIIRNGQRVSWPEEELGKKGWIQTLEDINFDPSSIYLTSNQKINNFLQASTNWNSFGINAIIPLNEQKEAGKCIDKPADHLLAKPIEVPGEEEDQDEQVQETPVESSSDVEDNKTETTDSEETTGLCDNIQLFPPYLKSISGQSFTGTATAASEEPALDIAKSNSYDQVITALQSQGYNSGDVLQFVEGQNVEYTKIRTGGGDNKEITITHIMTILNCDGTPVQSTSTTPNMITEEEAGLVDEEKQPEQYQQENELEEVEYADPNLPSSYRLASTSPLYRSGTEGMINCGNCSFHQANQCSKWSATVKAISDTPFVCSSWKQIDTVSSSRYKLLSAAYIHEDFGLYGSYESRFGSSNNKAIYLFKADSDNSIPQVPNPDVNKRYTYSGNWVTVPGFGATSSDYSSAAQQALKQLNDKNPGKWSLI